MRSRSIDLGGPVHVVEWDGPADGPVFVCVHGLGGTHLNWFSLGPLLAQRGRVLALDLIGHGRTPAEGRTSSIESNLSLIHRFVTEVAQAPVVLVGNSMGGALSILEAARYPEHVSGLVLLAPASPRSIGTKVDRAVATAFGAYVLPGVGERFVRRRIARLGPEGVMRETLALTMVDPSKADPAMLAAALELAVERARMPWAIPSFLQAARSLVSTLARRSQFMARVAQVSAPALVIAGRHDRLVPLTAIEAVARARANWELVVLDDVGHVPQIESPAQTFVAIEGWLDGPAARAIGAGRAREA